MYLNIVGQGEKAANHTQLEGKKLQIST